MNFIRRNRWIWIIIALLISLSLIVYPLLFMIPNTASGS